MAKASDEKQFNNFVKGLITEASAISFPENSSLDEDNFVLERTGKRKRRQGIDYETDYILKNTEINETILQSSRTSIHQWVGPSGDTDVIIGVVRLYNKLWFVNLLNDSPSTEFLNNGDSITITGLQNSRINTAVINNDFVIASKDIAAPVLLEYDRVLQTISQEDITLKVRDIWGIDDGLDLTNRPTTLSTDHHYNLKNQGWANNIINTCVSGTAVACTKTDLGGYPSNADVWTLGKVANTASADFDKYDPASLAKNSTQNAEAGKGFFIIDPFSRGASRETESDLTGLPLDSDVGNFTAVESFAGRVFYSGIDSVLTGGDDKSPNYNGYVFFSQLVTSNEHLGRCYMEADPTDKDINDIIETDGGTIQIPGITQVHRMVATKSSLLIFAQNGVWEIFGDTGGFSATSFQVSKVSSVGMNSPDSIVEINGVIVYWALAGIFVLTQDEVSGRFKADNASITTIQTFYNNLSALARSNAIGFYEEQENRVRWMFSSDPDYADDNHVNRYNRELIFDLTLQAFYPNTITELSANSPFISGYAPIPTFAIQDIDELLFVGNEQVLSGTDEVVVSVKTTVNRTVLPLFLTTVGSSFTFSSYKDTTFNDWVTADGTGADFSSFLITGYNTYGDMMRRKWTPYLFMVFDRTEDGFTASGTGLVPTNASSCNVRAQWNWADSAGSGKWGVPRETYRYKRPYFPADVNDVYDWGEAVITTKNKLRGTGKVLSLYMYSSAGKDCRILGWAIQLEAGARP